MIDKISVIISSAATIISLIWGITNARKASKDTKEIERLKTELNQKTHIRVSLFDYEFKSYIRLMGLLNSMLDCNLQLFPHTQRVFYDKEERRKILKELYVNSVESRNKFILALGETRPFINEEIYSKLSTIQAECFKQILLFEDFRLSEQSDIYQREDRESYKAAFDNQDLLIKEYNEISSYIKEYLSNNSQ